jgi:hypothetical protein
MIMNVVHGHHLVCPPYNDEKEQAKQGSRAMFTRRPHPCKDVISCTYVCAHDVDSQLQSSSQAQPKVEF